jgi:hypothetical protein
MLLGAGDISSFDDESDRSRICASIYPGLKASILSKYPWRFLMGKAELSRDAVAPINEWSYSYVIPGAALSGGPAAVFYNVKDRMGQDRFEIFGRRLYTDEARVFIDMVGDVPESAWPAYFQQLMVYAVAADIAFAITDQQSVATAWYTRAYGSPSENGIGGAFGDAMTFDAQASANIGLQNNDLINARYGAMGAAYDFIWPGPP